MTALAEIAGTIAACIVIGYCCMLMVAAMGNPQALTPKEMEALRAEDNKDRAYLQTLSWGDRLAAEAKAWYHDKTADEV